MAAQPPQSQTILTFPQDKKLSRNDEQASEYELNEKFALLALKDPLNFMKKALMKLVDWSREMSSKDLDLKTSFKNFISGKCIFGLQIIITKILEQASRILLGRIKILKPIK